MAIALTVGEKEFYEKTYRNLRLRLISGRCTLAFAKEQLARFRRDLTEGERREKAGEVARG
jgi:hypothetical protein